MRPSSARTLRPISNSTRHSVFLSATTASGDFRDHPLLQPVLPYKGAGVLPRDVDVHVDSATHEVIEENTRRTILTTWFELHTKPLRELAESMMHAPPRHCLTDFDGDHTGRPACAQREDDPVDLPDFAPVGIDYLLVEDVAGEWQRVIHRAPPAE